MRCPAYGSAEMRRVTERAAHLAPLHTKRKAGSGRMQDTGYLTDGVPGCRIQVRSGRRRRSILWSLRPPHDRPGTSHTAIFTFLRSAGAVGESTSRELSDACAAPRSLRASPTGQHPVAGGGVEANEAVVLLPAHSITVHVATGTRRTCVYIRCGNAYAVAYAASSRRLL